MNTTDNKPAKLVRAPKPLDLGKNHKYVLLPDGRVAKLCDTSPCGRQQRVHITVNGRRMQVNLWRVQAALAAQAASNPNPNKNK